MSEVHDHDDPYDLGLAADLSTLLNRRRAMKLFAGAALITLGACGGDDKTVSNASTTTSGGGSATSSTLASGGSTSSAPGTATTSCETIPEETAGPFPGDGSNGPNVLDDSGIVRSDITSSFGSSTTKAGGVPLTVKLVMLDQSSCKAMAGAAVYLWHCDREGRYSLYSNGVEDENYLRGVQEADADGLVTFKTIFPAAYSGRWPHIHFEVYPTLAKATSQGNQVTTSQLALPEGACKLVYATAGYEQSVPTLAQTSLARDNVFRDGSSQQLATMSGSVSAGYTAELSMPV